MWVLDIFGEHEHPYVIRLWSKFPARPKSWISRYGYFTTENQFSGGQLNRRTLKKDTVRRC
jgi:hypothetical protein